MSRLNRHLQARRLPHPSDLFHPARMRIIKSVRGYTMLPRVRLSHLARLAQRAPTGAFVECGSHAGGSAALLVLSSPDHDVWLFDSWEGCPAPSEHDIDAAGRPGQRGDFLAPREKAEELFGNLDLDPSRVHLVQGWFEDTLPVSSEAIGPIALLHLDGDWYESTRLALEVLYDQVVPGGFVVIDDYVDWLGCRKAVDEFMEARGLDVGLLQQYDMSQVVFKKP